VKGAGRRAQCPAGRCHAAARDARRAAWPMAPARVLAGGSDAPPLTGFLREHPGAGAAPASWRPSGPGVAAWCLRTLPWAWTQAGGSGSAETLATSPGPILPR